MKIIWLGHSGFRIEIEDQTLLIDPWLAGNPAFPADREADAIAGATAILITHGHGDHASDALRLAKATGAPIVAIHEIAEVFGAEIGTIGFSKGGTVTLGAAAVTMVPASHSSSFDADPANPRLAGSECGFMIAGEGHMIYVTGDTGIMADMGWMGEYFAPDIGILCAGGHYTMDMRAAAWAAKRFFNFKTVIPCHYRTFPVLAQNADALVAALPGVRVLTPQVMEPVEF